MADDANPTVVLQPDDKGAVAVFRKKRHLMWANFLGGLSWGFGSVMGATLLVAIVLVLLKLLGGTTSNWLLY
jgi:hypothetical protein